MQISSEELQSLENKASHIYDTIAQLKELNEELQTRPIIRNTNLWELNSEKYRLSKFEKRTLTFHNCDFEILRTLWSLRLVLERSEGMTYSPLVILKE